MSAPPAPPTIPRPDASELWSLAETLGIELPQEKHLLHIVRSAMKSDLPPNWSAHQTVLPDGSSAPFYFNAKSGQSRWLRPITAANHEALRVARAAGPPAAGSVTVPSSSAATPATTPPHSKVQTPRGGPASAVASAGSLSTTAAASSSSAIATAASTAARFLLSPPSAASSGSATPNASTPGRKSKSASIDTAAGFSLEIQKDILASFDGASLRCVRLVQRCFRRWRHRKQELIRAKIKVHRATMDKDMMEKLAMGHSASKEKRRTTMEAGASLFLAQAAAAVNSAQAAKGGASSGGTGAGLQLPASARTTPSTPARTPTGRQSPVSSSPPATSRGNSLVVPGSGSAYAGMTPEEEAAARAAKKRASMLRMLNIQNRFRADGSVEVVAMPDPAPAAAAAPAAASSTPAKASVGFADDTSSRAAEDGLSSAERRGGSRLNNRRRTFTHEDTAAQTGDSSNSSAAQAAAPSTSASASAASAASGSPRPLRPSPSSAAAAALAASSNEALKSWRFLRLVIRAQKRFKAHRAAMRARLAEKIAAQQRRQTQDTDRKLRRASLPFSDLSAIRKRLSNQPAVENSNDSSGK